MYQPKDSHSGWLLVGARSIDNISSMRVMHFCKRWELFRERTFAMQSKFEGDILAWIEASLARQVVNTYEGFLFSDLLAIS